jgi:hypothetical protein
VGKNDDAGSLPEGGPVMRVTLLEPALHSGDKVKFEADGGHGSARWRGQNAQAAGVSVDVELEVQEAIDWSRIQIYPPLGPIIESTELNTLLQGTAVDLDQEGVLTLRMGKGTILIDTTGEPPVDIVCRQVRFAVQEIEIYPTGI